MPNPTTRGRWILRGNDGRQRLADLEPHLTQAGQPETRPIELEGRRVFLKARGFRGKARLRHAVRFHLLRQSLPRLREFDNLGWLRAHGFGAPEPLVAGALLRNGFPAFQFLVTAEVRDAQTLDTVLAEGTGELRRSAVESLGGEVARLHGLGFVHRDLFPRNVLVRARTSAPELFFLDAWRGGPGRGLRGPRYDVECLLGELPTPDDEARFLAAYRSSPA